jgi:hypothetical protein
MTSLELVASVNSRNPSPYSLELRGRTDGVKLESRAVYMRMLFSSPDRGQVKQVRKKLFEAGIPCEIRQNPVAAGEFEVPTCPELWVSNDGDILRALRLLGTQRLSQMTVVFQG